MVKRMRIFLSLGRNSIWPGKLLAVLFGLIALAIVPLILLGLWLAFATAVVLRD